MEAIVISKIVGPMPAMPPVQQNPVVSGSLILLLAGARKLIAGAGTLGTMETKVPA